MRGSYNLPPLDRAPTHRRFPHAQREAPGRRSLRGNGNTHRPPPRSLPIDSQPGPPPAEPTPPGPRIAVTAEELAVFLEEAGDLLELIEHGIGRLGDEPHAGDDTVRDLLRATHTLKGSAAMLGDGEMAALAHDVEDVLDGLRSHALTATPDVVNTLRRGVAALRNITDDIANHQHLHASGRVAAPSHAPVRERRTGADRRVAASPISVRVEVERLDTLMTLSGQLAVECRHLREVPRAVDAANADDGPVQARGERAAQLADLVRALHAEAIHARVAPIETVGGRLAPMARELARKLRKEIEFSVDSGHIGIDRVVLEGLRDPLVHLLRNAVDHGIESPAERRALGKPVAGSVRLAASYGEGGVLIRLEDDGRGIAAAAVRAAAAGKGVVASETAARLGEAETLRLAFEPAVSTATVPGEISGRGVGLDVVRRGVAALDGAIDIETTAARGTAFTLRFPQALALVRCLLVGTVRGGYALPVDSVQAVAGLEERAVRSIMQRGVFPHRGDRIPLARLDATAGWRPRHLHLVVVEAKTGQVALAVETVNEQQDVIVHPLDPSPGMAPVPVLGRSVTSDGGVVEIVNVDALVRAVTTRREQRRAG